MEATHFLTRTLEKVRTAMSLQVLAYNIKRVIQILGVGPLMAAIRTLARRLSDHLCQRRGFRDLAATSPQTSDQNGPPRFLLIHAGLLPGRHLESGAS